MLDAVRHTLAPFVVACSVVVALCASAGRAAAEDAGGRELQADQAGLTAAAAPQAPQAPQARGPLEPSADRSPSAGTNRNASNEVAEVDEVADLDEVGAEAGSEPGEEPEDIASDPASASSPRRAPARKQLPRKQAPQARTEAGRVAKEAERLHFDLRPVTSSPVPGVESSGFGWREDPFHRRRKFHKGMDFRAPRGTAVYSAGTGVVLFAGRKGGYGNAIFIDHGDGVITRYGHLRSLHVATGAKVSGGIKIGEVGSTGRATGPHLHFEVRLDGRAVNPQVAMSLANLQRTDPTAARAAAVALAPEVQEQSFDRHTRAAKRVKLSRPERRGRAKRSQVLW